MKTTQPIVKDRGSLTLAEILEADGHLNHLPGDQLSQLTIPVRDWITKFVAGEETPYGDSINPDDYETAELIVSVLAEDARSVPGEGLPKSAVDFVEEWLYRMEEASNLHVWNVADIARPFLAHALSLAQVSDSPEGGKEAIETALSILCTKDELTRFYERANLTRKSERTAYKGSQAWRDQQIAVKAARVLADPSVPEEIKNPIRRAINELGLATNVSCLHPALAERALTLMFESKSYIADKSDAQRDRKALRNLIRAIPASEQTREPGAPKDSK
jgi:hypothetical protein